MESTITSPFVRPSDFTGTDREKCQAAINAAAALPHRTVVIDQVYDLGETHVSGHEFLTVSGVDGLRIVGNGGVLRCKVSDKPDRTPGDISGIAASVLTIKGGARDISIEGVRFEDTGLDPHTRDDPAGFAKIGAVFVDIRKPSATTEAPVEHVRVRDCQFLGTGVNEVGELVGGAFIAVSVGLHGGVDEPRVRDVRVENTYVHRVRYGFNAIGNGDDVVVSGCHYDDVVRSHKIFGCAHHDVHCRVTRPRAADGVFVLSNWANDRNIEHVRIRAYVTDIPTGRLRTLCALVHSKHIPSPDRWIRQVELDVDLGANDGSTTHMVELRSFDAQRRPETETENVYDHITIRGRAAPGQKIHPVLWTSRPKQPANISVSGLTWDSATQSRLESLEAYSWQASTLHESPSRIKRFARGKLSDAHIVLPVRHLVGQKIAIIVTVHAVNGDQGKSHTLYRAHLLLKASSAGVLTIEANAQLSSVSHGTVCTPTFAVDADGELAVSLPEYSERLGAATVAVDIL